MEPIKKLLAKCLLGPIFWVLGHSLKLVSHPKSRMMFLNQTARILGSALHHFETPYTIIADGKDGEKGAFLVTDGKVRISAAASERHLKASGDQVFEGNELIKELAAIGITSPKTIVDVGANFGEISLCFSSAFPEAQIVAVEPVASNLEILNQNLTLQTFDTSNISVLKFAVSDHPGDIKITNHLGSQNSIVAKTNLSADKYETVPCIRIDEIFEREKISSCDFLKIDIEGAEPELRDGLSKVLDRTQVVQIEISYKNTADKYQSLVDIFIETSDDWDCYSMAGEGYKVPLQNVIVDFKSVKGKKPCRNYWFVKR